MEKLVELFYETSGVCTDTRSIQKDCLFICLSGANFNGNEFAAKALELGAKYVICDDPKLNYPPHTFLVENSLLFLQKLANHHRRKFRIPLIGITGSNGKTTSKELIHAVLSKKYKTLATSGNLNNHIGVPLTLLKLDPSHEIAVIEMGANKFRDISELCEIAEPTHGLITNIGKAHLEGFIDFEGVLRTKKELYDSLEKNHGLLFYNEDDEVLKGILPENTERISYGTGETASVKGRLISLNPFVNMSWKSADYESEAIQTQLPGKYNFYNFLAAISTGVFFKVNPEEISQAIATYQSTNNRSQITETGKNTLILDAYNANPTSMLSALESFAMIDHPNKTAVLGDMFELGRESAKEHLKIVELVQELKLQVYFIGERFYEHRKSANGKTHFFNSKSDFHDFVKNYPVENQLVLLKGSRGIGLEEFVEKL